MIALTVFSTQTGLDGRLGFPGKISYKSADGASGANACPVHFRLPSGQVAVVHDCIGTCCPSAVRRAKVESAVCCPIGQGTPKAVPPCIWGVRPSSQRSWGGPSTGSDACIGFLEEVEKSVSAAFFNGQLTPVNVGAASQDDIAAPQASAQIESWNQLDAKKIIGDVVAPRLTGSSKTER